MPPRKPNHILLSLVPSAIFWLAAAACHFDPVLAPHSEAECGAACQRRAELKCGRLPVDVPTCTDRCVQIEKLRAQVTHAPCVAKASSCPAIDACSKSSSESP